MKYLLGILFIALIIQSCSQANSLDKTKQITSIEEALMGFALKEDASNEEFIKSHLLLSNLILTDDQISKLEEKLSLRKDDGTKYLLTNYLLWMQTQENTYKNEFIKTYPTSEDLQALNKSIISSDYRIATSPFQKILAFFAMDDNDALAKLLQSIEYSDGANADELGSQLREIYKIDESRIVELSKDLGINIDEIITL